jgi:hypothetical protein
MFGILARLDLEVELGRWADKFQPAFKRKVEYCVKCGYCCVRRACVPSPTELIKIAEFLKITTKEALKKYFTIDRKPNESIYFPRPINESQTDLAGEYLPPNRSFDIDKCIFQDDEYIIRPVRPRQAHQMQCWIKDQKRLDKLDEGDYQMFLEWKNSTILIDNGFDGVKMEKEYFNRYTSVYDDEEE